MPLTLVVLFKKQNSKQRKWRKMNRKPTKKMESRSLKAFFIFCAALLLLIGNLFWIQIVKGEEYRLKAERNQLSDTIVAANRGTIYDSNMKVLAQSASAWLVYINPSKIKTEEQKTLLVDGFVSIFDLDAETVTKKVNRQQSGYEKIIGQIDNEQKAKLQEYISQHKDKKLGTIIGIDPDTKRYYPLGSFASTVIGFTGSEDTGRAGLELKYNSKLTGSPGRIITAQNVDIAKYGNYSCAPQSSYSSQSIGIPRKRRKLKMSRILFALVMLIGAIIISFTMIAMPDHFFPEENTPIYYDHDVTSVDLSDYPEYNIKCCIDKATDIRYIFNADSGDGIATVLYQEEFDTYIELVDVLSNEPVYCYPSYPDENITVIIDDNKYVIPPYMTEYSITTYEIENYVVASDDDGNKYFIPKYIFEKFEFLTFSETPESEISAEVIEVTVLPEIMNP